MMALTKEYFDQHMKRLDQRFNTVDQRFDKVETKIEDEIHGLATMVAKGLDDIAKRLDIRERVETLETKVTKIESALNVLP